MGGNPEATRRYQPHREGIQGAGGGIREVRQGFCPGGEGRTGDGAGGHADPPESRCVLDRGGAGQTVETGASSVKTSKGRAVLGKLSPVPMVSGKATVEIDGAHSLNVFTNPEQEFYIQLEQQERFGIIKLVSKGQTRVVEDVTIVPISKETVEERFPMEIFQKQMTPDGLYKIWPKQPFPPGEYAVVEFSEGKINIQVWDFAVKAK